VLGQTLNQKVQNSQGKNVSYEFYILDKNSRCQLAGQTPVTYSF
jgi:hypothetical protein